MSEQAQEQAESTAAKVLAIWAAYQAGRLALPDAVAAMASAVYRGKVIASRIADIFISTISNLPPLGITPSPRHLERLEEAVSTVVEDAKSGMSTDKEEAPEPRLENLATAEVLTSHQKSLRAAIEGQGYAEYVEQVAPDACEVCQPFRDQIHASSEGWEPHHPRCRCSLEPAGERDFNRNRDPLVTITRRVT